MPALIIAFLIFLLGAAVGSFAAAFLYRREKKETIAKGRSFCPFCRHRLNFFDLIPIFSFLFLRGRCRYCGEPIAKFDFFLEIFFGLLFTFVFFYRLGGAKGADDFGLVVLRDFICLTALVIIFIYDLKHQLIPTNVIFSLVPFIFIFNYLLGYNFYNLFYGLIFGAGFFFLQYVISSGRWIGGGDIFLGVFLGLSLGFPKIIFAVFWAYLLGAAAGLYLILQKRKKLKSKIAFGPYLALGGFFALYWGERIVDWYVSKLKS